MRVLYGIQGVGGGHISRSLRMVQEMEFRGAEVDILFSGGDFMRDIGREVRFRFRGFDFKFDSSGGISNWETLKGIKIWDFVKSLKINLLDWDLVISDFEPVTAWAGVVQRTEVIGISNQFSFSSKFTPRPGSDLVSEFVINNFAPVSRGFGLHFHKWDDFIYHPVIRRDILDSQSRDLGHYLVYLPYTDPVEIFGQIKGLKSKFKIFHPKISGEIWGENFTASPINPEKFQKDLVTSSGVICSSGFGTTSEAIHLGKRLMTIPIKNQWEQVCNDHALRQLGVVRHNKISEFVNSDWVESKIVFKDPVEDILGEIGF